MGFVWHCLSPQTKYGHHCEQMLPPARLCTLQSTHSHLCGQESTLSGPEGWETQSTARLRVQVEWLVQTLEPVSWLTTKMGHLIKQAQVIANTL